MKQRQKLTVFILLNLFVFTLLITLAGSASVMQGKEISETDPIIEIVTGDFEASNIDADSADFVNQNNKFEIETAAGNIFQIFWEHNGTHLHALVSTASQGYVAMGWKLDKPTTSGPSVMGGANIVIGEKLINDNGREIVRDDYGIASGSHISDTVLAGTNDTLYAKVTNDGINSILEFVYPLDSSDEVSTDNGLPVDVDLPVGGENGAYFIFSSSLAPDPVTPGGELLMNYHADNRYLISQAVFLQETPDDVYPDSLKPKAEQFNIFEFLNPVFGNLLSDGGLEHAVIPITAMFFFLLFIGIGFVYLIVNAKRRKWNLTSILIPLTVVGVFVISIFVFPLPRLAETSLPDSDVDVQIVIEAQIKPWTFNATVYENKLLDSGLTEFVDPESVYAKQAYQFNQLADPATRDLLKVDYIIDEDYGGLKTTNYTVFYGQTVRFVLKALDTEHGFLVGASETQPENDYFGSPLARTLPQHEILELYWTAPEQDTSLEIRCTFFCGADHTNMFLDINVMAPPTT